MSKKNDDFFREKKAWSMVKDELLACYLKPYMAKILATRIPVVYIDAFAGKGKFDDGMPGSPLIAMDIINEALEKTHFQGVPITPIFMDIKHADSLADNLKPFPNASVIKGSYEENIDRFCKSGRCNAFFYIDPFGIKALKFSYYHALSNAGYNTLEMLINFNSFGFMRDACRVSGVKFALSGLEEVLESDVSDDVATIGEFNELTGGMSWEPIIHGYKAGQYDGYECERLLTEEYCRRLGNIFKYVLNIPIRLRRETHPKYRMIHVTNHPAACVLMNNNMYCRQETIKEIQNSGQMSMFPEDMNDAIVEQDKVGYEIFEYLKALNRQVDIDSLVAGYVCRHGVKLSKGDICKQLDVFESTQMIQVDRNPSTMVSGKPRHYWDQNSKQTVKVRVKNA